jgi:signal transduction histidine kinase
MRNILNLSQLALRTQRTTRKNTIYFFCQDEQKNLQFRDYFSSLLKEADSSILPVDSNRLLPVNLIGENTFANLTKADLVIIDITDSTSNSMYLLGFAHSLGKPVICLVEQHKLSKSAPPFFPSLLFLEYSLSKEGFEKFKASFRSFYTSFLQNPLIYQPPFPQRLIDKAPVIDLERLENREFENLCFELISQMGFRKVNWDTDLKEFDLVATLPKKDPDGHQYSELWFIVTGHNSASERLVQRLIRDPEYLIQGLTNTLESNFHSNRRRLLNKGDSPITILFILNEDLHKELFERRSLQDGFTFQFNRYALNVRIRTWDSNQLIALIQKYPQLAFKYFSEESKVGPKFRKSQEELYRESIELTEQLLKAKVQLEEEQRKRFIAEREAAWKDVAFRAAHKLGNPVDAADTYLQSLKRRLSVPDFASALNIANNMDVAIEEAKSVIGQFKSLSKIEEINKKPVDIHELITHCCKTAAEKSVTIEYAMPDKLPLIDADPARMIECFSELVANSMHWLNKPEKKIKVTFTKAQKKDLPQPLNSKRDYIKILFEDNGGGIPIDNKEKIFSPFFSTYQHGTGLGLAIVRKVIEKHDGWILEAGKFGEGASFEIFLPTHDQKK